MPLRLHQPEPAPDAPESFSLRINGHRYRMALWPGSLGEPPPGWTRVRHDLWVSLRPE